MTAQNALGQRMKEHESVTRHILPRRCWTILRVDGRAFHSYTRGLKRPFDAGFASDMDAAAIALASEVTGTAFAYVQSDEISLCISDFANPGTQPWFGGVISKMTSVSASVATAALMQRRPPASDGGRVPLFDSRVFPLHTADDVVDYFIWRQRDAVKNSISMAAQANFSHGKLQGLNSAQMQELLFIEARVNWHDYPDGFKRGRVITKQEVTGPISFFHKKEQTVKTQIVTRSSWAAQPAPELTRADTGWLHGQIPKLAVEALTG